MTAINAFLKRDRAILMTDAAVYTMQGLVVGFGQKAFGIPAMKAAVATRGAVRNTPFLVGALANDFPSIDAAIEAAPACFPPMIAAMRQNLPEVMHAVEIVVVGWSDAQNRARGLVFASGPDGDECTEIDGFEMLAPWSEEEERNLHAIGCELDARDPGSRPRPDLLSLAAFDPVRHGIPIMESQRRVKDRPIGAADDDPEGEFHIVGGHILLTEVTRAGVQQRVVHRWNDVAGENIQPEPFRAPQRGSTRKQRAAA